jgi:drug/metabolite transporter (DMT)-like permease
LQREGRALTVVFALAAAFCNAFNLVAQHRASSSKSAKRGYFRLALYLVTNPLWLLGGVALIGAFVFQALALHDGELSIVQPLLVTELVFTLVLRRVWIGQHISVAAWTSAAVTAASLAVFVAMAEPHGGHAEPTSSAWLSALLTFGLCAGALAGLASHGSPARRAGLYATAASIVWALEATFIKSATDSLTSFGAIGALERWPIYGVVAGGIAGTLLVQAALHVGPLRVSQPLIVAVDPLVSVILGMWVFGEHFNADALRIAIGCVAFVVMAIGVVAITRTSPPTLDPDSEPAVVPAAGT